MENSVLINHPTLKDADFQVELFVALLAELGMADAAEPFVFRLLTRSERVDLAKRVITHELIKRGCTYKEINSTIGASAAKVSAVKKIVEDIGLPYEGREGAFERVLDARLTEPPLPRDLGAEISPLKEQNVEADRD